MSNSTHLRPFPAFPLRSTRGRKCSDKFGHSNWAFLREFVKVGKSAFHHFDEFAQECPVRVSEFVRTLSPSRGPQRKCRKRPQVCAVAHFTIQLKGLGKS